MSLKISAILSKTVTQWNHLSLLPQKFLYIQEMLVSCHGSVSAYFSWLKIAFVSEHQLLLSHLNQQVNEKQIKQSNIVFFVQD